MIFADLDLARRLEAIEAAKYLDYAAARGRLLGAACCASEPVAGGHAIFAGSDNPYSCAVGMGLDGPVSDAEFRRFEAFYHRHGVRPALSLCPLADATLLEHLGRRGYAIEMFMHVWYRPLARYEADPMPPGLIVAAIRPEEADLWTLVAFRGGLDSDEATPNETVTIAPYPHMDHAACYLAWCEGEPAGAGTLGIYGGGAALFGASTRVPYRNHGLQLALLHARLAAAAQAGCDIVCVHTEPGSPSQRNVERLGFRLAYTKATMAPLS